MNLTGKTTPDLSFIFVTKLSWFVFRHMTDSRAQILAHQMVEIRHLIGLDPERMKRAINFDLDLNLGNAIVGVVNGIANWFHSSEIQDIKENQNQLHHSVDLMSHRIEVVKEMNVKNRDFISKVSKQTHKNFFLTQVHHYKSVFFELSVTADKIINMIINLKQHRITPDSVDVELASEALDKLSEKVSESGEELIVDDVVDIFDQPASFSIHNQTVFDICTHIKTFSENPMKLVEFIDLPLFLDNRTYDIQTSENLLAVNSGLLSDREVFVLNQQENKKCREFKKEKFLCHDVLIQKSYSDRCLPNLYEGKLDGCSVKVTNETQPKFVRTNEGRSVILSLPTETEVAIICPHSSDSSVRILTGIQQIDAQSNCQIHVDQFYIPALGKGSEKVQMISRKLSHVKIPELKNFTLPNVDFLTDELNDFEKFRQNERPVSLSRHDLGQTILITVTSFLTCSTIIFIMIKHLQVNKKLCCRISSIGQVEMENQ